MPNQIQFFDEAVRVGGAILAALGDATADDSVASYFERCGKICRLMAQVHDEVASLSVRVSLARDLDEAKHALSRFDNDRLADVFRARQWCDEFERLGKELEPLADELSLADTDRDVWREFCGSLRQREGEVAYLYEDKLYDLRRLKYTQNTLEDIRDTVDVIAEQLVTQKAKFDLLAMRAEEMRRRMH